MSLDEACKILSNFLNEGRDYARNEEKKRKKEARDEYWASLKDHEWKDYAHKSAKRANNFRENKDGIYDLPNSMAKDLKHFSKVNQKNLYDRDPMFASIAKKDRDEALYSKPEKVAGNAAHNKEVIKKNLQTKSKLKEACLTILEALECEEEN